MNEVSSLALLANKGMDEYIFRFDSYNMFYVKTKIRII